jgi:hypothetical protein
LEAVDDEAEEKEKESVPTPKAKGKAKAKAKKVADDDDDDDEEGGAKKKRKTVSRKPKVKVASDGEGHEEESPKKKRKTASRKPKKAVSDNEGEQEEEVVKPPAKRSSARKDSEKFKSLVRIALVYTRVSDLNSCCRSMSRPLIWSKTNQTLPPSLHRLRLKIPKPANQRKNRYVAQLPNPPRIYPHSSLQEVSVSSSQ